MPTWNVPMQLLFFVASKTSKNKITSGLVVLQSLGPVGRPGQWTLDFAPYGNGQLFMSPVEHNHCPKVAEAASQDQTFDLNYADPGTVVIDPTNNVPGCLLMIYEGTNRCIGLTTIGNGRNGFHSTIAVATSNDYGRTWPSYRYMLNADGNPTYPVPLQNPSEAPQQPMGASGNLVCIGNDCTAPPWPPSNNYGRYAVLEPQVTIGDAMMNSSTNGGLQGQMGDSEPAAFIDDAGPGPAQYLYELHNYAPGPAPLRDPPILPPYDLSSDLMVARAQLNGGTAPLQFSKWDGTSFVAGTGLGGAEQPVFPVGSPSHCEGTGQLRGMGSISYVDAARQYLLIFVCVAAHDPRGSGASWYYSVNTNLESQNQWSPPVEINGSWSTFIAHSNGCQEYDGWYPSFMSLGSKLGHLTSMGYVFYMKGCKTFRPLRFNRRSIAAASRRRFSMPKL